MQTFILLALSLATLSNALVPRQAAPAQPTSTIASSVNQATPTGANVAGAGGILTTTANAAVNSAPYTVPINPSTYFWTSVSIIPGVSTIHM